MPSDAAPKPSAPLCETIPRPPGSSDTTASAENSGLNVAMTLLPKPTAPMQFGPINRRPPARARATVSACSAAPSSPVSANPEDAMIATLIPAATQSSTAAGTRSAETTMNARSIGPGASSTEA